MTMLDDVTVFFFILFFIIGLVTFPSFCQLFYNQIRLVKHGFFETKKYRYVRIRKDKDAT